MMNATEWGTAAFRAAAYDEWLMVQAYYYQMALSMSIIEVIMECWYWII